MKAVTTTVYVSWNGEQFDTEEECLRYEEQLNFDTNQNIVLDDNGKRLILGEQLNGEAITPQTLVEQGYYFKFANQDQKLKFKNLCDEFGIDAATAIDAYDENLYYYYNPQWDGFEEIDGSIKKYTEMKNKLDKADEFHTLLNFARKEFNEQQLDGQLTFDEMFIIEE